MKERHIDGYIYNSKTAEGFERMKKRGIPKPLFSVQNRLAKALNSKYRRIIRNIMRELKLRMMGRGVVVDGSPEEETLAELLKFFDERAKEIQSESEKITSRANMQMIADELEREWFDDNQAELERLDVLYEGDIGEDFRPVVDKVLAVNQADYLKRLKDDASPKLKNILEAYEIDKSEFFARNLAEVRRLYVDNSLKRIAGESDLLKRRVLSAITDYATGKSDVLNLADLTRECYESSNHLSRFFARDQMQRFNKACTLATFQGAGVTRVKWVTSHDGRVRATHKALDGKIFPVGELPPEVDDYNCRCGLVPVAWEDDE